MGASLSSDVYQFKVDEICQDKPQCEGIANDIVSWTEPEKSV